MKKTLFLLIVLVICGIYPSYPQGSWSQSNLSSAVLRPGTAALGSKVYFAGGARELFILLPSSDVDIYDVETRQWKSSSLSIGREYPAGVSCGSKVLFAGGVSLLTYGAYPTVDIYDTATQKWSKSDLSQAKFSLAAVSYGNQVLFAGGINALSMKMYKTVDIYNTDTGEWKTDSLSEARCAMGYAVCGTKAVFAGGLTLSNVTDKVDIYDFASGIWSTATLSQARCFLSATAVGSKVIIAGGMIASDVPSDRVDIYDVITGVWTTSKLSQPRGFLNTAAAACGKAFFAGGGSMNINNLNWSSASDIVDIYNLETNSWSVEKLSHPLVNHGVAANGNQLFVGGGSDLHSNFKTVDIYTCTPTANRILNNKPETTQLYPNPASEKITLTLPAAVKVATISIIDLTGKPVCRKTTSETGPVDMNISSLARGIYFVKVETAIRIETIKFIISR
jgi:hypothetical protein